MEKCLSKRTLSGQKGKYRYKNRRILVFASDNFEANTKFMRQYFKTTILIGFSTLAVNIHISKVSLK